VRAQRRRGVIIEEKHLRKPPTQDCGLKSKGGNKSFANTIQEARHKVHGVLLHLFNDHVYCFGWWLFLFLFRFIATGITFNIIVPLCLFVPYSFLFRTEHLPNFA
jgi:hypothetical protein